MANNIEDFLIKVGFDSNDALKNIKKFLNDYEKLEKKFGKRSKKQTSERVQKEEQVNTVLKARTALQRKINQAEKAGVDVSKYKRSLSAAKKIETIKQRTAELDSELVKHQSKAIKQQEKNTKNQYKQKTKQNKEEKDFLAMQEAASKERLKDIRREVEYTKKIESMRRSILRSAQFQRLKNDSEQDAVEFLRRFDRKASQKDIEGLKDLKSELRDVTSQVRSLRNQQIGLATVQTGLRDSTRNLVRSYASLFALFEGTTAINRVGQQFEGMRASMLAASGGAAGAKEDLAFIREEAVRLGVDLVDASDAFVKLKFAGKDSMSDADIKNLFTGFSEFATALQVDKFRQQKGMMALTQMMNKSQVMAEELKNQLGEQVPGAIQVFARALNVSTEELFDMMERGELIASEVLPKVAHEMRRTAREGGALSAALATARVQQARFMTASQEAADIIFKAGFGEGFSELLKELVKSIGDSEDGLKGLGKTYEVFFTAAKKLATPVVDILDIFLEVLGSLAYVLNTVLDSAFGSALGHLAAYSGAIYLLTRNIKFLNLSLAALARKILLPIALLEELFAFFDPDKLGLFEYNMFGGQANLENLKKIASDPMKSKAVETSVKMAASPAYALFGGIMDALSVEVNIDGVKHQTEKIVDDKMGQATYQATTGGSY